MDFDDLVGDDDEGAGDGKIYRIYHHVEGSRMLQILDVRLVYPCPYLNVVIDYFSHSFLKMCKIQMKHLLDVVRSFLISHFPSKELIRSVL